MRRALLAGFCAFAALSCDGELAAKRDYVRVPRDGGSDAPSAPLPGDCGRMVRCDGACIQIDTDPENCGACYNRCPDDYTCGGRRCIEPDVGLPARPSGPPADGDGSEVFAIRTLYLGDITRDRVPSSDAWRVFGLNIDGLATNATSTNVCTPAHANEIDGAMGVDNSWGHNILPILRLLWSSPTAQLESAIGAGSFTTLIRLDKLGARPDYSPVWGAFYTAASLDNPQWRGDDVWPIDTASVYGGDVKWPQAAFVGGYVRDRVWVGAPDQDGFVITLGVFKGVPLRVTLDHVQVKMTLPVLSALSASGTISGVIRRENLREALRKVAGALSPNFCSDLGAYDPQILAAADIMNFGSNRAGVACDSISFGVGFTAIRAKLGAVVSPPPPPSACAD